MSHFAESPVQSLSPLFRLALISGPPAAVKLLLARGAVPDARDGKGDTALMIAAARGRTEICRLLLEGGANLALTNAANETAFSLAFEQGHRETADMLAAARPVEGAGRGPALEAVAEIPYAEALDAGLLGVWEAEEEAWAPENDSQVLTRAVDLQEKITAHRAQDVDDDWSDIVIELPRSQRRAGAGSARARSSVRFRRLRVGQTRQAALSEASAARLEAAVVALDLSRPADAILHEVTLAQVIRSADTSKELRKCVSRSKLFDMCAAEFLADDDGETRFLGVPDLEVDDYLELADLMNAFTVLVHREASHDRFDRDAEFETGGQNSNSPEIPAQTNIDPEEKIRKTSILQVLIVNNSSSKLRKAISISEYASMSVAEFLQEEDGEALFRENAHIDTRGYFELSDIINDFTEDVYRADH